MKLLAALALATTASACIETTTVHGSWRDGQSVAGACHTGLFTTHAQVQIFDTQELVASDEVDCDELGFSLEIPADITHVRVTATDPQGGHRDKELDIESSYLDVGLASFDQTIQPD